jgi:YgiT-type zinc finger domain-containing protein
VRKKTVDACEYCQSALGAEERHLTVYRHRGGKHFIFERVPARVCPRCGERYFSAQVVRAMDRLMQTRGRRATVAVPVIALRAVG